MQASLPIDALCEAAREGRPFTSVACDFNRRAFHPLRFNDWRDCFSQGDDERQAERLWDGGEISGDEYDEALAIIGHYGEWPHELDLMRWAAASEEG